MEKKKGLICISVMGNSTAQIRKSMMRAAKEGDMVELRIDGLEKVRFDELLPFDESPLIVTDRRKEEGGLSQRSDSERVSNLKQACEHGATYVDLEYEIPEELRHSLMKSRGRTKVILSYHNQKETPPLEDLLSLWHDMSAAGPDVVKIIPYAETLEDSLTVLNFLGMVTRSEGGTGIISHCMGEEGKISRILSPMFGSMVTFASLEESGSTAPGQMSVGQMRKMWEALEP